MDTSLAEEVQQTFELAGNTSPNVEQVQDIVEKVLIDHGYVKTAKSYILYRAERSRIRDMNNRLMKTYEDITFKDTNESDIKRENANMTAIRQWVQCLSTARKVQNIFMRCLF